jgi:hypothetical protein
MKRMLILLCCLLLAFAANAAENSAVIGANTATKGTVNANDAAALQAQIAQLKQAGAVDQVRVLSKQLDELIASQRNSRNSLDACNTCDSPNATISSFPSSYDGTSVSGDCGTEGKWYAQFTGVAGTKYHFDLCPTAPGAGTSFYDSDIKICNSTCTILAGADYTSPGSACSWEPNDFQWSCTSDGTYYVVVAPYSSSGSHTCGGTSSNTLTMEYYAEALAPPPENDMCLGAIEITAGYLEVDNTNATDDAVAPCGFYSAMHQGIWYKVQGNDNYMTATTCGTFGTLSDTKLSVYSGDCDNLVCVGGSDDDYSCSENSSRSTYTWCTDAGVWYYIFVGGYYTGASGVGTFPLTLTEGVSCHAAFDCNTLVNCGTPVEVEPNDACPPPANQAMLGCVGVSCPDVAPAVYGLQCPTTDLDFWAVCVPALSKLTVTPYQGTNCDVTPVTYKCQFYYSDCATTIGSAFSGASSLTNSGGVPAIVYLKVYNAGGSPAPTPVAYKLTASCCELEYLCASAIPMGNGTSFHTVINTCPANPCGSIPAGIWSTGCGTGTQYASGPSRFFTFTLSQPATNMNIIITGGDLQMMLFTDCANPYGTCVRSVDNYTYANGEALTNLALPAGTYYLSVSFYGSTGCGDITVDVTSDVQLPVEMGEVSIRPLDNAVELTWTTRSETNLDKWIVKRDNVAVYQVNANNGSSGHHYTFTDAAANGRTYTYDLVVRNSDGSESVVRTLSATPTVGAANVTEYALHQNYPNPFNPTTDIIYDVKDAGFVTLKVYNMMGQEVTTLVNGNMTQGRYTVSFNATDLPSGLYLCKMTAGSFSAQVKMLLMK